MTTQAKSKLLLFLLMGGVTIAFSETDEFYCSHSETVYKRSNEVIPRVHVDCDAHWVGGQNSVSAWCSMDVEGGVQNAKTLCSYEAQSGYSVEDVEMIFSPENNFCDWKPNGVHSIPKAQLINTPVCTRYKFKVELKKEKAGCDNFIETRNKYGDADNSKLIDYCRSKGYNSFSWTEYNATSHFVCNRNDPRIMGVAYWMNSNYKGSFTCTGQAPSSSVEQSSSSGDFFGQSSDEQQQSSGFYFYGEDSTVINIGQGDWAKEVTLRKIHDQNNMMISELSNISDGVNAAGARIEKGFNQQQANWDALLEQLESLEGGGSQDSISVNVDLGEVTVKLDYQQAQDSIRNEYLKEIARQSKDSLAAGELDSLAAKESLLNQKSEEFQDSLNRSFGLSAVLGDLERGIEDSAPLNLPDGGSCVYSLDIPQLNYEGGIDLSDFYGFDLGTMISNALIFLVMAGNAISFIVMLRTGGRG